MKTPHKILNLQAFGSAGGMSFFSNYFISSKFSKYERLYLLPTIDYKSYFIRFFNHIQKSFVWAETFIRATTLFNVEVEVLMRHSRTFQKTNLLLRLLRFITCRRMFFTANVRPYGWIFGIFHGIKCCILYTNTCNHKKYYLHVANTFIVSTEVLLIFWCKIKLNIQKTTKPIKWNIS